MKTIELAEGELVKILEHYKNEYEKNLKRATKLKALIRQLHQEAGNLPGESTEEGNEDYILENKISGVPAQKAATTEKARPTAKAQPSKKQTEAKKAADKPQSAKKPKATRAKSAKTADASTKKSATEKQATTKKQSTTRKKTATKTQAAPQKKKAESKVINFNEKVGKTTAGSISAKKKSLLNKPEKRNEAIVNYLKEMGVPLSANDFIVYVKKNFNVEGLTAGEIRLAINKLLNDLVFKNQVLKKQYIPSENTHYYGLKEWFKKDNVLSNEYMKKLENYLRKLSWSTSDEYTATAR